MTSILIWWEKNFVQSLFTSKIIPCRNKASGHSYTVVRMAGGKEAGDKGFAIYYSHEFALDQKTRNHLENIYWVCFQCQAHLGKGKKQVWRDIWYLLSWSSETTNLNEKGNMMQQMTNKQNNKTGFRARSTFMKTQSWYLWTRHCIYWEAYCVYL